MVLSEIARFQGQQREESLIELRRIVFEFLLKGNTFYSDMPEQYRAVFREELYDLMVMDKLYTRLSTKTKNSYKH